MTAETKGLDAKPQPKAKVFISYSRKDMASADRLEATLKARGFEPLIDRTEIYAFEEWWKRIEALIAQADTVVFVLSPDSVVSEVTLKEIAFAASLNKRFAPVVCRRVDDKAVPEVLAKLNFIFFDEPSRFEESAERLAEALSTDIGWIRMHTEVGEAARRWAISNRPNGLLLRSPLLDDAERWIAARPVNAPAPTEDTQAFIRQSRQGATRRRNVLTGSLAAGLLLALSLAGVAYWQRDVAVKQTRIAEERQQFAEQQRALAEKNEQRAVIGEDQAKKNEQRAVIGEEQAKRERDKALLTQSRFLADLGNQQTSLSDPVTGMLLAIEALPDKRGGIERPDSPEAVSALSKGIDRRHELAVFSHSDKVVAVAFSPDGQRGITASDDGTARLWDMATYKQVGVFERTTGVVSAVFSPDGQRLAISTKDHTVRIWDFAAGQQIAFRNYPNTVVDVAFSPDGRRLAIASYKLAEFWDLQTGRTTVLKGNGDWVASVAFSPDGKSLVTASFDKTARLWNVETGKEIAVLNHDTWVASASFSPDGKRVVTASGGTATIWDVKSRKATVVLQTPVATMPLTEIALLDGKHKEIRFVPNAMQKVDADPLTGQIFLKVVGGTALFWEAEADISIVLITEPRAGISKAAFSPDGRYVATASWDKLVRIWDAETGKEIASLGGHDGEVVGISYSPDGLRVMSASTDKTARLWNVLPRHDMAILKGHGDALYRIAFSSDGRLVVTTSEDKTARVWKTETGRQLSMLRHDESVFTAFFSSDARLVITTSEKAARIWDLESEKQIAVLNHDASVSSARFSPDGRRVVTASWDKIARIWDVQTTQVLAELKGHNGRVNDALFSPDGSRVVTLSDDKTARLWDTNSGEMIAVFKGHGTELLAAAFTSDGQRIATGSYDSEVRIWDAKTTKQIAVLNGHTGGVRSVVFSPDDQFVITVSGDGTAHLWDAKTNEEIAAQGGLRPEHADRLNLDKPVPHVLIGDKAKMWSAALSPDGRQVGTASGDGTARLWDVLPRAQDVLDLAKQMAPRCLTILQRKKAFLDSEPPAWCVEMEKWPYQVQAWKDWLKFKRAVADPPLPDSPNWQAWIAAHK